MTFKSTRKKRLSEPEEKEDMAYVEKGRFPENPCRKLVDRW